MKLNYKYIALIILSFSFFTCTDLDIENTNDPDIEEVLSTSEGIKNLTGSLFNNWFNAEQHNLNSPGPALWVMADWGTVTFANYGTIDMSKEPRQSLNNTAPYAYHRITRNFYRNMYGILTSANDILQNLDRVDLGSELEMITGMSHFMQGLSNGYIGLLYDKSFPSDETTIDYTALTIQPYSVSLNMAIEELEKAIVIFDNNTFTLPEEWMSRPFTNEDLSKIAHSFIARLMVYGSRNTAQNEAVDWEVVLTHAQAGITEDFTIEGDGNIGNRKWMSWYKYFMARSSWGKVDMRIVHMIDNNLPANWPEGGLQALPFDGIMDTQDFRASTDFEHNTSNNRPERGTYRWSTYRYARFDDYIGANFFAPVVMMRKAENDLFIAEAHARLNQYDLASADINAGTRTTRGSLPNISNNPEEVNQAIIYERTIELPLTGMGIQFFDMRRRGALQDGSILHFPIPAQQLEIIGIPLYTFGGLDPQFGVPNEDVSVNGWFRPE